MGGGNYDWGDCDEYPEFYDERVVKARKLHKCCECHIPIPIGVEYQRIVGKWDGQLSTFKTCMQCAAARKHIQDSDRVVIPYGELDAYRKERDNYGGTDIPSNGTVCADVSA